MSDDNWSENVPFEVTFDEGQPSPASSSPSVAPTAATSTTDASKQPKLPQDLKDCQFGDTDAVVSLATLFGIEKMPQPSVGMKSVEGANDSCMGGLTVKSGIDVDNDDQPDITVLEEIWRAKDTEQDKMHEKMVMEAEEKKMQEAKNKANEEKEIK